MYIPEGPMIAISSPGLKYAEIPVRIFLVFAIFYNRAKISFFTKISRGKLCAVNVQIRYCYISGEIIIFKFCMAV